MFKTFFFINLGWGPVPHFAPWKNCNQCGLRQRFIVLLPRISNRSYSGRQASLASTTRGSPLAARGGTMGEKWWPDDD
jgi:hypothetical protein